MDTSIKTHLPLHRGVSGWVPRPYYDFLDIGCGDLALRVQAESLKHPEWYTIGVDPSIFMTRINGNLDLVKADADEVLQELPDRATRAANADYFFNNMDTGYCEHVLGLLAVECKS